MAPTATASFTPVCAPWAAAMMMLAGFTPSSKVSTTSTFSSSTVSVSRRSSGMIILAIRMPPGADMKEAARR